MSIESLFARRSRPVADAKNEIGFFDPCYSHAIENYELGEVFPDVVLFNFEAAKKHNARLFRDYPFLKGSYFQVGQSGQGDFWFLRRDRIIHWCDHDLGEIDVAHLVPFHIGFVPFIDMAMVIKNAEALLDDAPDYFDNPANRASFKQALDRISPGLFDRYPYQYF
jgi:hypothetical protein